MTLRVGIIGVGWGAHVQVPGFRAAKGFEPVAVELAQQAFAQRRAR